MMGFILFLIFAAVCFYEKSLQALSECGKMEAVEIEKELAYEIS